MAEWEPIRFVRDMNDVQQKRINDHKASVAVSEDGSLQFYSEKIVTPKGLSKINRRVAVVPSPDEKVETVESAKYVFQDLQQMNVILTNACNLSCSYCYEQHNRDFGRFTNESLMEAYNFLLKSSGHEKKIFQFFGGEPLIHKDLILGFLRDNADYLDANSKGFVKQYVSCVTNGLLMTKDFLEEYFSYDFTHVLISLDTIRADVDHREIGQKRIDKLIETIRNDIPQRAKDREAVVMRCTLAQENAPYFLEFVDTIYNAGVHNIVVHPLILDSRRGFIKWEDELWDNLHKDILTALEKYDLLSIHFSEGVGQKGENNCMVGSDMVAIDGSGDFSGCYFFTNQKANGAGKAILGNIFEDRVYIDRYRDFQMQYANMMEEEEQCRTCDYKNACYQCPAGNLDTGSRIFRPDDMCQKIVKLYVDLQNDVTKKQFRVKYDQIHRAVEQDGFEKVFTRAVLHLMFKMFSNFHATREQTEATWDKFESHEHLIKSWKNMIEGVYKLDEAVYNKFVTEGAERYTDSETMNVKEMYEYLLGKMGIPSNQSKQVAELSYEVKVSYLVFLHLLILNNERKILGETPTSQILS